MGFGRGGYHGWKSKELTSSSLVLDYGAVGMSLTCIKLYQGIFYCIV